MRVASLILSVVCLAAAPLSGQYRPSVGAPETFRAQAQVRGTPGAAAATLEIVIQRYTPDPERTALERALETGGYPAFVAALRKSADVGYVEHGTAKFTIRYARETKIERGRRIDVVTDRPVFFLGGGAPEARPRDGFDVAVLRIEVEDFGFGSGEMAAAARLKLGADGRLQIDDYSEQPIKLITVTRKLS